MHGPLHPIKVFLWKALEITGVRYTIPATVPCLSTKGITDTQGMHYYLSLNCSLYLLPLKQGSCVIFYHLQFSARSLVEEYGALFSTKYRIKLRAKPNEHEAVAKCQWENIAIAQRHAKQFLSEKQTQWKNIRRQQLLQCHEHLQLATTGTPETI